MSVWVVLALPAAAIAALAIYPGELSWLPGRGTRWLYDRAAKGYSGKHGRHDYAAYDAFIARAAQSCLDKQGYAQAQGKCQGQGQIPIRVLDLGCGTGRATLAAAAVLGDAARYSAVDFSPAMLDEFRSELDRRQPQLNSVRDIHECDITAWLETPEAQARRYDLLLCMEVGEFLPSFPRVLKQLEQVSADAATLVITRPAGFWAWCFPGRAQTRRGLAAALAKAGYSIDEIQPWRGRYELLRCRRGATTAAR